MIGAGPDAGRAFLAAFRASAGDLAPDAFEATVSDPSFPGALLTWRRGTDAPVFYAAASTSAEWRRLRPLILAFAGPTLTSFSGALAELDSAQPQERFLAASGLSAVARLVPQDDTATSTERALKRLVALLKRAPPRSTPPPETTGRLLSRIRDHLNALAIDEARGLLERCRAEHRLDALNLKFLEVEILATARDWAGIVGLAGFDELLRTRRPPNVTAAFMEALYWSNAEDGELDVGRYADQVRPRARDLIRNPAPTGLGIGGWRLYGLEALTAAPPNLALASLTMASGADLGALGTRLFELTAARPAATAPSRAGSPATNVGEALIVADLNGGLAAYEQVRALLAGLTDAERARLLTDAQSRAALSSLEASFGDEPPPSSWPQWFVAVAHPSFTTALTIARQGAMEWPAELGDPTEITTLAHGLLDAPDIPPGADRLIEALPHFVAWLQRDPAFPRTAGYVIYEATLDRLLLSGRTAAPLLDSATVLARAMLTIGPTPEAYGRLLRDLLDLAGEAVGLRTTYWLLDLLEESLAAPAPDQAARETFWQSALAKLTPVAPRLSMLQRISLRRLAGLLGWQGSLIDTVEAEDGGDSSLAECLSDKVVAIYTLTESAGRQAAEALRMAAPGLTVHVNSDHVGGNALKALAENSDLFIIVAGSATHAATDFIRAKRGNRPLAYAPGRGSVSILRAVEDWAQRQARADDAYSPRVQV